MRRGFGKQHSSKAKLNRQQLCTRRILMIIVLVILMLSSLVFRLIYLQFFRYSDYRLKSDQNRIKSAIIPPVRGMILDRNGVPLAENKNNYRLVIYNSKQKMDYQRIIDNLVDILNLDETERQYLADKIYRNRRHSSISLIDKLTWEDLARLEVNSYKLPGISVEKGQLRYYPFAESSAHCVGYAATPSSEEVSNSKEKMELLLHPDFRLGKSGVEKSYEQQLRGKSGWKYLEVNAYGTPVRELSINEGQYGKNVNLTIDAALQKYAYDRIKNYNASVVLMDIYTGEILVMVSAPAFNPNDFVWGVSKENWLSLINNAKKPLNNKPTSAIYPPASTIKLIITLTALQDGIITPKTNVNCKGYVKLGRRKFHCWKEGGHGKLDIYEAIAHSCGSYFFTVAKHLDIDSFSEMAHRFGLGESFPNLNFPDIKSGTVPNTAWKRKVLKQPWVTGDTLNVATGQGFLTVTPLQLAVMVARIANGGYPVKPILDREDLGINSQLFAGKPMVPAEHLEIVKEGMFRVSNTKGGTAYWARIKDEQYQMAGKTGTAQVISKREEEYEDKSQIPEYLRNHGLFVAFAPFQAPRFAIAVVVENGISGTVTAAPIARDILLEARKVLANRSTSKPAAF